MIQKTLWSPDTCECQIEYQWDDAVAQEDRVHTVSRVLKACPIHDHHADIDAHYEDVLKENQSKNKAIGLLVKTLPKLDGGENEIQWSFDKDRNVILSHPLLTQADIDIMNTVDKTEISKEINFI